MTEREQFKQKFREQAWGMDVNEDVAYEIWQAARAHESYKNLRDAVGFGISLLHGGKPVSGEAVAWSWVNRGRHVTVDKSFAEELRADGELVVPLYTHPARAQVVPEAWRIDPQNDHGVKGFIIGSPLIAGVRDNTYISEDSDNPAERLLYLMLSTTPPPSDESLQEVAERVCGHVPEDMVISLCMENGAAWVQLGQDKVGNLELPDSADKTLVEQINDALCVAKGWTNPPAEGAE